MLTFGHCPARAATKGILPPVRYEPLRDPDVDKQTHNGTIHANVPRTLSANVIATACETMISSGVSTVKEIKMEQLLMNEMTWSYYTG